jgi:hypothetical protein
MRGLTCSSYAWSCVFLTILLWSLRIFMLLVRCSSILRPCSILLTVASCVLTQCPTHTQSVCVIPECVSQSRFFFSLQFGGNRGNRK